ncbi:hypothetical protein F6X40_17535 [Paraburkholderia sp. UCT31]|uniref:hypothetical protein n=1 Tax=Paraburkholderia sp. UCT31 TaxID=2615209 RepID=UPI0016553695|nr:hypothetical protein [Paraburkholderia sp. UCT31]MBC8738563.1 hypothetical protein [Paraburkholderia sp. UCT31]
MHRTELRLLDSGNFEGYLDFICAHLGLSSKASVPDGTGELATATGYASFAVSRENAFAAFQWIAPSGDTPAVTESFFVTPQNSPARSGLRIRPVRESGNGDGGAPTLAMEWRAAVGGVDTAPDLRFPAFVDLVAILANHGRVVVGTSAALERARVLESEVEHLRIMLLEQSDHLQTAKENLRHIGQSPSFDQMLAPMFSDVDTLPSSEEGLGLEELPAWAVENTERIVILPRALNGAKKSQYQSPATIMASLEILAGPYRDHRLGRTSKAEFEAALAAEGLQLAGSVAPAIAGEQGDAYFVNWGGRRRFLEFHLLKGGGREPRYCMRIYFFWDAETERCVVGVMPQHLPNSLS